MQTRDDIQTVVDILQNPAPPDLTSSNLLKNDEFINWLLPMVHELRKLQYAPKSELNLVASIRLQQLLARLREESKFWRGHIDTYFSEDDVTDIDDVLGCFPVIDKETLNNWGEHTFLARGQTNIHTVRTSGSTGTPGETRFTDSEIIANVWPYFFFLSSYTDTVIQDFLSRKFLFVLGRSVLPQYRSFAVHFPLDSFAYLSERKTRECIYSELKKSSPVVLWAFASVIFDLLKYEVDEGAPRGFERLHSYLHLAVLSGESLSKEEYLFVHRMLRGKVTQNYTTKETGKIGTICEAYVGENTYHVHVERAWVEILNDENKPVSEGEEGEIVVTVLDRVTTPIIRYAIGDRGSLVSQKCSCGKSAPLLKVHGRENENIRLSDGTMFSVLLFRSLLVAELGLKRVKQYQIIQESLSVLRILVVLKGSLNNKEKSVMEIIFSSVFDNKIAVVIEVVRKIKKRKSGKSNVFIPLQEEGKVK